MMVRAIGDLVGRVAAFEIRLNAIEHRRRDREISQRGEAIAHRANVVIDAENLLDHHQAALRLSLRLRAISTELETVRSGERDLRTQGSTPFMLGNRWSVVGWPRHRTARGAGLYHAGFGMVNGH